jgi:hypothetical protein
VEPLYPPLNAFILAHVARLFPEGFDKLSSDVAPSTWEGVAEYLAMYGRMGVSADHSDATVYGDPHVNHAFRAWHDWTHYILGPGEGEFTVPGERAVLEAQCRDMRYWWPRPFADLSNGACKPINVDPVVSAIRRARQLDFACHVLYAEVVGQLEHRDVYGGAFPENQRGFVMAYMRDPAEALRSRW